MDSEPSSGERRKRSLLRLFAYVALGVAAIAAFEQAFPRDEAAARELLEGRGYRDVSAHATRRYCGRNRSVFRFEATTSEGQAVTGTLCFDLFRWFSSVDEDP